MITPDDLKRKRDELDRQIQLLESVPKDVYEPGTLATFLFTLEGQEQDRSFAMKRPDGKWALSQHLEVVSWEILFFLPYTSLSEQRMAHQAAIYSQPKVILDASKNRT